MPTWGGLVGEVGDRTPETLDAGAATWLEAEARMVGLLRGARPERVAAIRATIDRRIQAELEREAAASQRWDAAVRRGASMAPGGAGLWLGLEPPTGGAPLPTGFEWTFALAGELRRLPEGRFRLVVAAPGSDVDPSALAGFLDVGGVMVAADIRDHRQSHIRVLDVDDDAEPSFVIVRRQE